VVSHSTFAPLWIKSGQPDALISRLAVLHLHSMLSSQDYV
jgi:hypothetical protein